LGKSIPAETELKASFTADEGEPAAQAVTWDDADGFARVLEHTPIGVETKNRIVAYDRSRSAQCASESQVDFARVPPRSSAHFFIAEPRSAPRAGLETATGAAIIFLSGKPIAVV